MPKLIGSLFIGVLLLIACGQALSQSIPPSKANSPVVTPYLHIISCYDMFTGNLLDCRVFDELVGIVPPPNLTNSGFHQQHVGSHPLVDLSTGASGFVCLLCTDLNPNNPLIIETNTDSATAVIRHSVPQFAGRLQVKLFITPPPGWSCLTDCIFDFVEEVGVDGLSELPFPGPNLSYDNSRAPDTRHPIGSSGTSDTLIGTAAIAQGYLSKKGAGLKINDLSLPRGGKFDLGGAYGENDKHASHRTGKDVDIGKVNLAGTSIDCFKSKDLQQLLTANGVGRVRLCEAPPGAYHIRFD